MTARDACPSSDDLAAFAAAGLAPEVRLALEAHLEECTSCATYASALIESTDSNQDGTPRSKLGELRASAPSCYRLHRLIGAGGMGLVYEAEEAHSGRRVALKMAREVEGTTNGVLQRRFFREARVAAMLEHPNIVPVFDIGEFPDGAPYYTQRLIEGRSLGSAIAGCRTPRERLALMRNFLELCGAVAYAHGHGVIHRDLKPTNVILGRAGETWVIDWGLARLHDGPVPSPTQPGVLLSEEALGELRADPMLTAVGTAVGTPAYMSPEQARGELERVDERSDVWSLGVLLFEILVGHSPFLGLEAKEILKKLRADKGPRLPVSLEKEIPPELCAIAARALRVAPGERYPSAIELARDVNSWLVGGSVSAHQYGLFERTRRWVGRHPALTAAAMVALLAGGGWVLSLRAANLRLRMKQADVLVDLAQRAQNVLMFDRAAVDFAGALALDGNRIGARIGLAATGDRAPRPLWRQVVPGGKHQGLAFSDDRTLVALGDEGLAVAYELASGGELARTTVSLPAEAVAGCASGDVALAGGNAVALWNPRAARAGPRLEHPQAVRRVAFSLGCELLATASSDGVRVYRLPGGELAARFGSDEEALDLVFLSGRRLLWATRETLHDAPDALVPREAPAPRKLDGVVRRLSFAGHRLLATLESGRVLRFELAEPGAPIPPPLPAFGTMVRATEAFLSPDGLAETFFQIPNGISFFDGETGEPYSRLAGMSEPLRSGALSPDGRWLAVGADDEFLRTFDLGRSRTYAGNHPPHPTRPLDLDVSARGDLFASAEEDGDVRLWDAESGHPREPLGRHASGARAVRFSPDGRRLASAAADGVRLWEVGSGASTPPDGGDMRALAWLADGQLAAAREDGLVARRNTSGTWSELHHVHQHRITALCASRDGRLLASADSSGMLVLFDLERSRVLHTLRVDGAPIGVLAISPDGRRIASGGESPSTRIWDALTGAPLEDLTDYGTDTVTSLDFAPESAGSWAKMALLVGYRGGRLLLWRSGEGAPLVTLQPTANPVVGARFSPDGQRAIMLDGTDSLRILPLTADLGLDPLARLMRFYKFEPAGVDVMRDEVALIPPALRQAR